MLLQNFVFQQNNKTELVISIISLTATEALHDSEPLHYLCQSTCWLSYADTATDITWQ